MKTPDSRLQNAFFFLILLSLTFAFWEIFKYFLSDTFLALILIILFKRPFAWFVKKCKGNKKKAAGFTTVLTVFVIIIPLMFVGMVIANELGSNYTRLENNWDEIKKELTKENLEQYVADIPVLNNYVSKLKIEDVGKKLDKFMGSITSYLITLLQNTFANITSFIIHTFMVIFLTYFLFAEGHILLKKLKFLIPLKDSTEDRLIASIQKVTDGIVFNSFLLGTIEGVYGGILFALLGIPSPVFWGMMMAGLSIVPLVGTNFIMVPAALIHFLIGDYGTGTWLLTAGTGVILLNQNIIRPKLDADKSGMHTAMALIASLGGLMWLGVIGFLAGPIITALFIEIWDKYSTIYREDLIFYNAGGNLREQKEMQPGKEDSEPSNENEESEQE